MDRIIRQRMEWTQVVRYGKAPENPQPLTEYANDPVGFCRDILGIDLWEKQVEIMESVRDNPRTSVAACYASGKTFTAACLCLWWIYTRRPAMVITTAPTGRQVKTLLWREIRKLYRKAKRRLPGRLLQTQLQLADDWWGMGFASDAPNSVAGLHESANVLFIEDEAAGMESEVVEGFEGITASEGSRHLKIGNPICSSGPFFDSHKHPEESKRWFLITIDAEQTPNFREGRPVVPGLVTKDWVEDKRHRWLERGLLHLWETKVKGKFYVTGREKVCPEEWVIAAQARWDSADTSGRRVLGVDVAGGGQDSTICALREGQRVRCLAEGEWQTEDLMEQARNVVALAIEHDVDTIVIDRTGLGQGVWSRVKELKDEGKLPDDVRVIGVQLTKSPREKEIFGWASDEIQWWLREAICPTGKELLAIDPSDKELGEQLSYRCWFKRDRDQKIVCDSKKEMRRHGLSSPDRADAVSLTTIKVKELNLF